MTSHEFMAELSLERFMADPDGREALALALALAREGLRDERWGGEYVAAIGQHRQVPPASWPMEQIAAFTEVHALIFGGSVAGLLIPAGEGPCRDADREGNAAILARLPRPFRAIVNKRQHGNPGDGAVIWDEPVPVSLATGIIGRDEDGSTAPVPVTFTIPPGRAVLEIGSTLPSRTWEHLVERSGRVARWPYGCTRIRLLVNLDPESMLSHLAARHMESVLKDRA